MSDRGYLRLRAEILCGICTTWDLMAPRGARKLFMSYGWVFTKAHGWVCPKCATANGLKHEGKAA